MNKKILNTGVQNFINKNNHADIVSVLLKKPIFEGISQQELAQQIESKKKCQKKLPTWFTTSEIYYPKKIHIEQTSSEISAEYKSKIVNGKSLLDVTGGFGIDSYYFSKKVASVIHCEIDKNLHEIATHNFKILETKNIRTFAENGLEFLKNCDRDFDWIYLDPSRRSKTKGKVFQLSDCQPDVVGHLELLFSKSKSILLKTAPLLDISMGIRELNSIIEVHIVAVNNEVKELLWVLKKGFSGEISVKTVNFAKSGMQTFNFTLSEEKSVTSTYSMPLQFVYEPNAAILKSGAFKSIGMKFKLKKLHQHTHLYTSEKLLDFPGRRFELVNVVDYTTRSIKELHIKKANITCRNFPDSVITIRKKHKIKEGGDLFLFFFKNSNDKYQVALCLKI